MIKELQPEHIGRYIWYIPRQAKTDLGQWEQGRIKSYDNDRKIAWVVYHRNNVDKVNRYQDFTGEATEYRDLSFNTVTLRK